MLTTNEESTLDVFMKKESEAGERKEPIEFLPELPEGWTWVKVKEISRKPQYGYTAPARSKPIGPKMLRITDIQDGKVNWTDVPYCKINDIEFRKYKLEEGDILFARTGATTGKTFLVEECPECIFASYLIRLKLIQEEVIPHYVYAFFQSPEYWKQIKPRGGAQPNMNANILANLKIPLPPLEEQKRITTRIGEISSRVEQARRLRGEALKEVEGVMQSALHEVFSKAEEKGWTIKKLEDVAEINRETRDPSTELHDEKFIYIDISGIEGGNGQIKEVKEIIGKNAPSRARRVVRTNDVIMSTVRPYLKSFAIVPKEYDDQICSTGFAVLSCREMVLPRYLLYALFSDMVINQCNSMMIGAHYPALNNTQVSQIQIPVPPLEEQKHIITYLDKLQERVEALKKYQEETKGEIEAMTQAVLRKAFSGKL